jgi:hypothetical protein
MSRRFLCAFLVLAAVAAAGDHRPAGPAAKVRKIGGIAWHDSLDGARTKAAPAEPRGKAKPVLYLRMLGDLAGKT